MEVEAAAIEIFWLEAAAAAKTTVVKSEVIVVEADAIRVKYE